ncbi:MAG: hypothetical protein HYX27_00065 [Acidobacteria bacterium]|nr:hypothetical protein [Acidobacteriota bacterium]
MRTLCFFLLFACGLATADTLLIKSIDAGRTWKDIDPGPPDQVLEWLKLDPRTSTIYALAQTYLGGAGHLLVSADGGLTWQNRQTFSAPGAGGMLAAGPASTGTLYLAYESYADSRHVVVMAKVMNGGETIEQYKAEGLTFDGPLPDQASGSFLVDVVAGPAGESRLYALTTNDASDDIYAYFKALWTSVDGGRNWRRLEPPVKANCGYPRLWAGPSDSSVYFACGSTEALGGGFFESTDGGESWTRIPSPNGQRIWSLAIGVADPGTLYTIVDSSLWKSTGGARTWRRVGNLPVAAGSLQLHPAKPSVLLASTPTALLKSDDGGETWMTLLSFAGRYGAFYAEIDPRLPDTYYGRSWLRQELRLNDRQTFARNMLGERLLAPGSFVSIYGQDLANETQVAGAGPLPVSLAGATVSFNGQPAPLLFVSPGQINAQVPFGLAPETEFFPPTTSVTMEVRRADGSVDRQTVGISHSAVYILRENPTRQAAPLLFHTSDLRRVGADEPVRRGEGITLFALGMGDLEPSIPAGVLPPTPPPQLPNPPCVLFSLPPLAANGPISHTATPSLAAGAAPGLIGVYRVNLAVPASLIPGSYTVSLTDRRVNNASGRECRTGYQGPTLDSFALQVQ